MSTILPILLLLAVWPISLVFGKGRGGPAAGVLLALLALFFGWNAFTDGDRVYVHLFFALVALVGTVRMLRRPAA